MSEPTPPLPQDADQVLKLAAQSMFDTFARTAMGTMLVDREHRIVWISEGYKNFLPALGFSSESDFVGRRIEEVVPNTLMPHVVDTGEAMLVDLLTNHAGTFLVSRLPLRDPQGRVIGALGMVLLDHPETTMQPLIAKFARLQDELDAARRQLAEQRRPKHTIASFIGHSAAAQEVRRQARRVAAADSPVLLLGETGTGKELLAHAIHAASRRAARPFVGVNIAAVPDTLLEAEFFGVAPGAYTGADRKGRDGKFKLAHGGTLVLDEIGELQPSAQSKLLQLLQSRQYFPLGASQPVVADIRVIAATNVDLQAAIARKAFRDDLYYRLSVLPIRVPALAERREDLQALADHFCQQACARNRLPTVRLSLAARHAVMTADWTGNVRQLANAVEGAAIRAAGSRLAEIEPHHLFPSRSDGQAARVASFQEATRAFQEKLVRQALEETGWNVTETARLLDLSRAHTYNLISAFGLARRGR